MKERHLILLLPAALLGLLAACEDDTGTPCQGDFACQSNTCTAGSCASPWAATLAEAFEDEDEPPRQQDPKPCWEPDASECSLARGDRSACMRVSRCTQR